MADQILLMMALHDGELIGGALNFIGTDTLYGRNWGASKHIQNLHFEACYYQAIEFAITHKLSFVEAGAQGVHKVQRGYLPITTYSAHWIAHEGFREAVQKFLHAETRGINNEQNSISLSSPFKHQL
jgi:predicted N-acyltransferase